MRNSFDEVFIYLNIHIKRKVVLPDGFTLFFIVYYNFQSNSQRIIILNREGLYHTSNKKTSHKKEKRHTPYAIAIAIPIVEVRVIPQSTAHNLTSHV